MNKLVSLLRSPYPVLFQRWKSVVIPSAIVAFILYAFQPFGISLKEGSKLGIAIGSGGITAGASVICHYLLPALFPSYYKEQHWTLGKYVLDLLLLFFLIAVGLWLYISWLSGIGMNGSLFLLVCTWVMILAPFPLVFCLIWNRNMVLARNLKEAAEINSFLPRKMSAEGGGSSPEKKEGDTGRLVFSGGTKDVLEVSDCDFLYASISIRSSFFAMVNRLSGTPRTAYSLPPNGSISNPMSVKICMFFSSISVSRLPKVRIMGGWIC